MKLPPTPLPLPPTFFHPAHCSSLIQQIGRKRRDRDSGRDGGSPSPQLSSSSCLYACLIGQKQHACLYSQGNGWTLDWAGGPGFSPSSFKKRRLCPRCLLLGCLGDVCCHCFANYCSPCIAGEPVEAAWLLPWWIGPSALSLSCCDMASDCFQDGRNNTVKAFYCNVQRIWLARVEFSHSADKFLL